MEALPLWLPVVFFLVAAAYSSVGFGGGSSYLAVLALTGIAFSVIPQTALVCNVVVAGIGVWHYARHGHLNHQINIAIWSIPCHPPTVPVSAPDSALGVNGQTIRPAVICRNTGK